MHLCIFEDNNYMNLEPLSLSRPVYELVCGITTLREKILRAFRGIEYSLHCRKYIEPVLKQEFSETAINSLNTDECLFINGRILASDDIASIFSSKQDRIYKCGNYLAAAKLSGKNLKTFLKQIPNNISFENLPEVPSEEVQVTFINYVWDLINYNGSELKRDFKFLTKRKKASGKKLKNKIHPGVHFINKKKIFIGEGSEIKPGCVLDASEGPIYIDKNVLICPNAVIEGPA